MQQTFAFAPPGCAAPAPVAKVAPHLLKVAVALNCGRRVVFPRNANAIRVTIGRRSAVILKEDVDTLEDAGMASTIEFGVVKNDSRGHPLREKFVALAMPVLNAVPSAKPERPPLRREQELDLSL